MASSPLARLYSRNPSQLQMYQPGQSSPLSGSPSPTCRVETRRKRQYKPQGSSRSSLPAPGLFGAFEDTPQKIFLRERFKARCLERARKGRGRTMQASREHGYANENSSDGFDVDDDGMDEGDDDVFNDEIYRRVMLNEARRSQYAQRVSFEQEFGSSIDPNMYEDMDALEREFTGRIEYSAGSATSEDESSSTGDDESKGRNLSPPADELDDALIQEYLTELEEMERRETRQLATAVPTGVIEISREDPGDLERAFTAQNDVEPPSPSKSMFSDFHMSSPPSSPARGHGSDAHVSSPDSCATWSCPFCSILTSRSRIACASCARQYPLDHAHLAWFDADSHPGVQDGIHTPLATKTPRESGVGIVMLCGAPECDWCFAL